MEAGFVLVCDAVRPRPDGLFDAIGAGYQYVAVDPSDRMFRRTCVAQILCEPEDVGKTAEIGLVLFSPTGQVLAACGWDVSAIAPEGRDPAELVGRPVYAVVRMETRVEDAGLHRLVVFRGERALAEWPVTVELRPNGVRTPADEPIPR
jgi:hypothetical protein